MIARRHSGIVCHNWTLRSGQPSFFLPSASDSGSIIPAIMNRSGHFGSGGGGGTTIVSAAEDGVDEETDSVSVSFSFLDFLFCEMTTSEWRRARILAYCFSFLDECMPRLRRLDIEDLLLL